MSDKTIFCKKWGVSNDASASFPPCALVATC